MPTGKSANDTVSNNKDLKKQEPVTQDAHLTFFVAFWTNFFFKLERRELCIGYTDFGYDIKIQ